MQKRFLSCKLLTILLIILSLSCKGFGQNIFIPFGSDWKFLDDGSDLGTAWRSISFNDEQWKTGAAPLGYGGDGEATTVSFGPDSRNKFLTTYFRKQFNVDNPASYLGFTLKLRYDDGGVVYLNGKEVHRANMYDGDVKFNTRAVSGSGEDETFLPASLIRDGENLIAVEIHQSHPRSSDIFFDLSLIEATKLPDFTRKPPYLIYNGNPDEMELFWQVTATIPTKIFWGTDSNYSNGNETVHEFNPYHQHKYVFKNLKPAQKYVYKVEIKDEIFTGSFIAPPLSDSGELKFLIYGDTRTYPNIHDSVSQAIISKYTMDEKYQTLLFCVGDLVSNGSLESHWDKQFFSQKYPNIIKLHAEVPLLSIIGNHERSGKLYQRYFPYPYVDGRYWSFDYGPAHFVIFDQYRRTQTEMDKELEWLENDLANSSKKWKFIFLHEPGWTAGSHKNNEDVQNYIQPLCKKYNVAVVFGGHNHYYSRAVVDGVQHITTGGGGAPLYKPEEGHLNVVVIKEINHFCAVDIRANDLHFSAISAAGEVFDEFVLK